MKQLLAKITENKKVAPRVYRMRIESGYLARNTKPGQFFEVKCSDSSEILLRRPLGAHRILKNGVEMLYEVVGKGTESLSKKKPREAIDIIGPLGHGFEVKPMAHSAQAMVLVAGGIGAAPLVALAEALVDSRRSAVSRKNIKIMIGAKTKSHILCEEEFRRLGCEVLISTDDGSKGKKGFITHYLKPLLQTTDYRLQTIYACGPYPMLKAVAHIAQLMKVPCQVSMEEKMACGVGVCLGCPVKVKAGGYKMVCKDGPVFDAKEIAW